MARASKSNATPVKGGNAMFARGAAWLGTYDLARRAARRRMPRVVFDYVDGGAESESTMRANRVAFESLGLEPRMGVTKGSPKLSTTVLGLPVSMPVLLSPVGFTRMMHRSGDVAGAAAAGRAGTVFTLSSMSGHTIEEVAAAATGPLWFQLYFLGGPIGARQLVERAQAAGYHSLVVTMDTQIPGMRERDVVNRLQTPMRINARNIVHYGPRFAAHPRWLADFARDRFSLDVANAQSLERGGKGMSLDEASMAMVQYPPTWEDFTWMREAWDGPIIAKGIVSGEDARRAVDHGASAIIVSNHGGRQVDGMAATLPALVEVLEAVGDRVEVLVDSGVRRGSDVARALALGARAVMIGRGWAMPLGAGGEAGIDRALTMYRDDLGRTLRMLGCMSVADLDRSYVRIPPGWADPGRGVERG